MENETHIFAAESFDQSKHGALFQQWRNAHGREAINLGLLPPSSVVLSLDGEPVAMGFMYLAYGVGVGHIDHVCTAPGLLVKDAVEVLGELLMALKMVGLVNNTNVFKITTYPAMARFAAQFGFIESGERVVEMTCVIPLEGGLEDG